MVKKSPFIKFILLYKRQVIILFFLGLFSSSLTLATPYLSRLFIDKAFIDRNIGKFFNLSVMGAGLFIFSLLAKIIEDIIKNRLAIKLNLGLANRFIKKFYSLDLNFLQSKSVGENIFRLSNLEGISNLILEQYPRFLVNIFKLPVILALSLWINARMTLFLLILSPLFIARNVYLQKKLKPIYEEIWRYSALIAKELYEAFSRILIIKAFGLEIYQRHTYVRSLIKNIRWRIKSFRWEIISSISSSFLSKTVYGAITLYGGWLIIKGKMSLGSYTAVMLYLNQLGGLFESLSQSFGYFAQEGISLNKFFEVMDARPGIKAAHGAKVLQNLKGEIQFRGVWFGYNGKPIIKGLNFSIPLGFRIGVAGPSGCGKTTLINLILRLYDPEKGEIYLDGSNLKEISLVSLRKKTAIAIQQPFLFDVSIRNNISYGLRNVPQEEIIEAAKIACVHNFIEQLPEGYDTLIGEDAYRLSQGLKQRVAIARAILRKPELLILDEATSSVDSRTEEKIFKALRERMQSLSTIIISHRLFSIKDTERIYFLREDGKLEEGIHSQLLTESTAYRDFFHNQNQQTENLSPFFHKTP